MDNEKLSRFLSMVLRHRPDKIGIALDKSGWADIEKLIKGVSSFHYLDRTILDEIVKSDEQRRFSYDDSKKKIRANYGHSVDWEPDCYVEPPDVLWHGSATKYEKSIDCEGLKAKSRRYVHLFDTVEKATMVGGRHGELVLYRIDAKKMKEDGHQFVQPVAGVYLTRSVPGEYIEKMEK